MFLNGDEPKNTAWDKSKEKTVNVFSKQLKEKLNEVSTDIEDKVDEMSTEIKGKDKKINEMSNEIKEKDKKIEDKDKRINEFDIQNEINKSNKQTADDIILILHDYNKELDKMPSQTLRYEDFEKIPKDAQKKIDKCIGMIKENDHDVFINLKSAMRIAERDLDKVTKKAQQRYNNSKSLIGYIWDDDYNKEKDQIQKIVSDLGGSAVNLYAAIVYSMPKKIGKSEELSSSNSSESCSENYSSLINTVDL